MLWPQKMNPEILADTIMNLNKNDTLRHKLEKGAAELTTQFSLSNIAEDTNLILQEVIHEKIY